MANPLNSIMRMLKWGGDAPEPVSATDLFQRVEGYENRKSAQKRDWREALAFHSGHHWAFYDRITQQFVNPQSPIRETQAVVNLFQAYVGTLVSMQTRNQPVPRAISKSDSPDDEGRSRTANDLMRHIWMDAIDMQAAVEEASLWAVLTGNAFFKVYWDDSKGMQQREAGVDEFGEPILERVGEPVVEVLAPFNVGFNDVGKLKDSPWVYHRAVYTPEDVYRRYGVEVDADSHPEDVNSGGVLRFDTVRGGTGAPMGVMVVDWYERPCQKYPEGRHIVATKSKVLVEEPWPNESVWPIYHLILEPTPGSPWGRTPFRDFIALQKSIDRLVSDIIDHTTSASYPSFFALEGQMDKPMTRGPGKIHVVKQVAGGSMPQPVNTERLEQWVLTFVDQLVKYGEVVTGISSVMLGQAQYSRMSGRAAGQFAEHSTNRYANSGLRLGRCLSDVGVALLELWRRYGPEEETIRCVGNDGIETYRTVAREAFDYRTLHIEPSDVLAQSEYALLEMYERWLQYGAIDGPQFQTLVKKINPAIRSLDVTGPDRAWANRNINLLKFGDYPEVKPPMDFGVHFEAVAEYMKSAEYFALPPEIKGSFESFLGELQRFVQPPAVPGDPGGGTAVAPEGQGIPGPIPSPGAQGVPAEANGSVNPPGVDLGEEGAIRGMMGG